MDTLSTIAVRTDGVEDFCLCLRDYFLAQALALDPKYAKAYYRYVAIVRPIDRIC